MINNINDLFKAMNKDGGSGEDAFKLTIIVIRLETPITEWENATLKEFTEFKY